MNFVEAVNTLKKFVGLANNFSKFHKTCKTSMQFVEWKIELKGLIVFL